jgi:G3E family GTPase
MKVWISIAAVFITLATVTTAAIGQKIYRCGSEYSQIPCADAVVVQADDPRSSAQKVQSDAMIQRNAAAARSMEKARLAEEAALRSTETANNASSKKKKHPSKQSATKTTTQPDVAAGSNEAKKVKKGSRTKDPDYFTARSTSSPKPDKKSKKE